MRKVDVYFNDIKAGELTELARGGRCLFEYNEAYLVSANPSLSVNLSKKRKKHESDYLFPFFSNMLPEGHNKKIICRHYHLDEEDLFGLLYVMADGEFIGAVNIRNPRNE